MPTDITGLPLPRNAGAQTVVEPEATGFGHWAGAPCALRAGTTTYLAYRVRRPVGEGRGLANVVARSEDGVTFTPLWRVRAAEFDAESLERPCLTHGPDGIWRLYVSAATPGTKHWRVELVEAGEPGAFDSAQRRVVFPGDHTVAMKDPVIHWHDGRWHAWVCCHPLEDPAATDRMWTAYATSEDGTAWEWHGRALEPRPGRWDSRGTRIADVLLDGEKPLALYDGRASAEENFEERTGFAWGDGLGHFTLDDTSPASPAAQSPDGGHGLRYVSVVPLTGGECAVYYEAARADGSHDLRVEHLTWQRDRMHDANRRPDQPPKARSQRSRPITVRSCAPARHSRSSSCGDGRQAVRGNDGSR